MGYYVEHKIVEATDYGVPQIRKRLIIVASKLQLSKFYPNPTHTTKEVNNQDLYSGQLLPCPTLWDAISDLPEIEACEGGEEMDYTQESLNAIQKELRGDSTKVYNHQAMKHSKRMVDSCKRG